MGLLSIFKRNKQAAAKPGDAATGGGSRSAARQAPPANTRNPTDAADAVREARARARRRLMGATVLLLVGVIGFPLLFETQPRPIPVDLPIEIPARNAPGMADGSAAPHGTRSVATLVTAGPPPESVNYDAPSSSAPLPASAPASAPLATHSAFASLAAALTSSSAGSAASAPASAAHAAPPVASSAHAKPAASAAPVAASHPSPAVAAPAKPADAASAGRFVVQVGAFTEEAKVHEARAKVERTGLKTYTQQVDTPGGKRVRVRAGPFATKAEADKAAGKIKATGLPAAVLTL